MPVTSAVVDSLVGSLRTIASQAPEQQAETRANLHQLTQLIAMLHDPKLDELMAAASAAPNGEADVFVSEVASILYAREQATS